jgi:hypothetical protein
VDSSDQLLTTPTAALESSQAEGEGAGELYLGDKGRLPLDTRRVLVQLLSGPSVDGRRHSRLWPVLMRDEEIIRSRLADLFLDLVVDADQKVAFTRQADVGELEAPILLRRSPLTFIDSVVLLYLRQKLTQADVRSERAVVDASDIVEHVTPYERAVSTDHAGFNKKVNASIEKMKKNSILQKVRGEEERYEISPTLKLLFSAEQMVALAEQYQELAVGKKSQVAVDQDDEEDAEV